MKMSQEEVFNLFKENLRTHEVEIEGNKIIGKRLIRSRSFSSFKITFLKNGNYSIKAGSGMTLRYDDILNLFGFMGCISAFTDYKRAEELLNVNA